MANGNAGRPSVHFPFYIYHFPWPLGSILSTLNTAALLSRPTQESAVVSHQKIRFDALNHIQGHADDDEQTRAAQEGGNLERNTKPGIDGRRNHGDDA